MITVIASTERKNDVLQLTEGNQAAAGAPAISDHDEASEASPIEGNQAAAGGNPMEGIEAAANSGHKVYQTPVCFGFSK